jgi:hypothetical protein
MTYNVLKIKFEYKPIKYLAQIFLERTIKQSKPKQTNKHGKKKRLKRKCGLLQENIQIATFASYGATSITQ